MAHGRDDEIHDGLQTQLGRVNSFFVLSDKLIKQIQQAFNTPHFMQCKII